MAHRREHLLRIKCIHMVISCNNKIQLDVDFDERTLVPSAMAFFAFFFYTVIEKQHLTVSKTFASLALFSLLQGPLLTLPEEFFRFLHGEQKKFVLAPWTLMDSFFSLCFVQKNQLLYARRRSPHLGIIYNELSFVYKIPPKYRIQ